MRPPLFRLCLLLTRELCRGDPLATLAAAVRGGVDCVQLREKTASDREAFAWGTRVASACQAAGVPLVVNDRVELALALGARGVHLGQEDMHPEDARRILGPGAWIGWSTHDLEQVDEAVEWGVDYAGFGPVFATETKGHKEGLGADHLAAALAIARLPLLAIGGIGPENAWMIPEEAGIAASSAICAAREPEAAARALRLRSAGPNRRE